MTPLDPQRLFDFLEQDPVYQRKLIAKEVLQMLSDEDWETYVHSAMAAASWEVREALPNLLTEQLAKEIRQIVRLAFLEAAFKFKELFEHDPADWWKGEDDDDEE